MLAIDFLPVTQFATFGPLHKPIQQRCIGLLGLRRLPLFMANVLQKIFNCSVHRALPVSRS